MRTRTSRSQAGVEVVNQTRAIRLSYASCSGTYYPYTQPPAVVSMRWFYSGFRSPSALVGNPSLSAIHKNGCRDSSGRSSIRNGYPNLRRRV